MNKCIHLLTIILLGAGFAVSQTKSVERLESEISSFKSPELFSAAYTDRKDITTVKLSFDLREQNVGLQKKFKEFVFELSTIYTGPGIDNKPFRHLLCINTRGKKFHFATNNTLTLSLDGGPIDFRSPHRETEFRKRKTRENLCWDIDRELIGELATLTNTQIGVGALRVSLPADSLSYFRNYAKLLKTKAE